LSDADDPRARFSITAADYHLHRPTYPPALFEWIEASLDLQAPARVADVGCGTGIATRLLAARGHDVVGIDPNQAMLEHALAAGGPARYARGEAAATGLASASVALVTVAQAFHWFDVPATLAELRRILTPEGACAAFWNLRDTSPVQDAYEALLLKYSSEYASVPKAGPTLDLLAAHPEVVSPRRARFAHVQDLTREGFHSRARSSSYVAHGVSDTQGFAAALDALFDAHAQAGTLAFAYRTEAILFRIAPRA
jgi:ubiquinone/menaquinone biosynthesis C-methylase UbiE